MIILNTNVLSEPLKTNPDDRVLDWLASIPGRVGVTSVNVCEILVGVRRLTRGRRRDGLFEAIKHALTAHAGTVLAYHEAAARRYAQIHQDRRAAERPLSVEDGMIAAICLVHGATLATRNVKDFDELGITLIDPWSAKR